MIEITIPRLGWSMDEGTFTNWLKSQGEFVNKGGMVFELEGEKAVQEIESFDSGFLCVPNDGPKPGDTVQVRQVIGFLLAQGEEPPTSVGALETDNTQWKAEHLSNLVDATSSSQLPASGDPSPANRQRVAGPAARRLARQLGIDLNTVATPDPTGRVISADVLRANVWRDATIPGGPAMRDARLVASPRARRRARELGVDCRQVRGTGHKGRVRNNWKATNVESAPSFNDMLIKLAAVTLEEQPHLNAYEVERCDSSGSRLNEMWVRTRGSLMLRRETNA